MPHITEELYKKNNNNATKCYKGRVEFLPKFKLKFWLFWQPCLCIQAPSSV